MEAAMAETFIVAIVGLGSAIQAALYIAARRDLARAQRLRDEAWALLKRSEEVQDCWQFTPFQDSSSAYPPN